VLTGNGGLYLPLELRRGADGVMTGFAFPEMLVRVCEMFAADDGKGAEDLFDAYLPLVRYEQQAGIGLAIRKEILRRRGVLNSAATRAPGLSIDADDMQGTRHTAGPARPPAGGDRRDGPVQIGNDLKRIPVEWKMR